MIDRIHHVGIVVQDVDKALGFYRDIMGLDVTADEVVAFRSWDALGSFD